MSIKREPYGSRLKKLWILALFFMAVAVVRLVHIQIISHEYYKTQAERNRLQTIYRTAPRGRIIAADGTAVAANQPAFDLYYLPAQAQEENAAELKRLAELFAQKLNSDPDKILKQLQSAIKSGKAALIAENMRPSSILPIAEVQNYYPGIYLVEENKRFYPHNTFASHLLGYMGSMEGGSWKDRDLSLEYRLDSKIGRFGLEKKYERELKGIDGGIVLEVDYRGRVKQVLEEKKWEPGADIYLTLNFAAQRAAEEGLKNSKTGAGAVVALDPRNGAVLALAVAPAFDPNIFMPYNDEDREKERRVIKEYNLAVQGVYPPASIFKIITAFAAMEEGKLEPKKTIYCPGHYDSGPRVFKCWRAHGSMDFYSGMAQSCDTYFYILSHRTGAAAIERVQQKFMFGRATGIDLPGERSGMLFGPTRRAKNRSYWFIGDTLNLSIGQGELLVTPVKMAQFAAALASKGKIWRPYYMEKAVDSGGRVILENKPQQLAEAEFTSEEWALMFDALRGVITTGTGRIANIKGLDVYGKTGTAQNPHGEDHAWFMAYAGREGEEPEIALAVFAEHGESGSSVAGPVAREILKAYFGIKDPVRKPRPVITEEPPAEEAQQPPVLAPMPEGESPFEIKWNDMNFNFFTGAGHV